jgi:DNA-binding GntR family transcriptional regulator
MGRLAADGLVTVRPRRGAEVRAITPRELVDAYQVREALEVLAVRLAVPRVSESDLDSLSELVDKMAAHAKNDAVADFFAANVSFHDLLCELSGNEKLVEVHRRLVAETGRFQPQTLALRGNLENSVSEHRAILAAIRERDADEAAALAAAHVRVPGERLRESLGAQDWGTLTASGTAS